MTKLPKEPKHHYIPCFYLDEWTDARGRLIEYSKQGPAQSVKTRPTSPKGTGYVRGLYRIDDIDPNVVNAVETMFLKPSDAYAADALQALLHGRDFPKPTMRTSWSRFVLSLMIRYPEEVALMKEQLRANVERAYIENRKSGDPPTFAEFEALHRTGELARLHGKLLMDLMQDSKMGRLIFRMIWRVRVFKNYRFPLLTSDRPVAGNSFRLSGNHLTLPISPNKIFFACDTEMAEQEFMGLPDRYIMEVVNDRVVCHAKTYVYGTDDRQLRFVQKRLGLNAIATPFAKPSQ
jgi:hypothetical protein